MLYLRQITLLFYRIVLHPLFHPQLTEHVQTNRGSIRNLARSKALLSGGRPPTTTLSPLLLSRQLIKNGFTIKNTTRCWTTTSIRHPLEPTKFSRNPDGMELLNPAIISTQKRTQHARVAIASKTFSSVKCRSLTLNVCSKNFNAPC